MLLSQSVWNSDTSTLNKQTNVREDDCELDSHDDYNRKQIDYRLLNFSDSGYLSDLVIDDSRIRDGTLGNIATATKSKTDKIRVCRSIITTPFMGAGQAASTLTDSELRGELGSKRKSCNGISGIAINRFVPLIPELADSIQDPNHLVESKWVRGGMPTRMTIRNMDYLKSCGTKPNTFPSL